MLLSGPPCSGKSTLAFLEQGRHGGEVLDWDEIRADITGLPAHEHGEHAAQHLPVIEAEFRRRAEILSERAHRSGSWLWIIRSAPVKGRRGMLRRIYGADGVVLAIPIAECLKRLAKSDRPASAVDYYTPAIRSWWQRYTPGRHELTIRDWSQEIDPLHIASPAT